MKKCTICKIIKEKVNFSGNKESRCKPCKSAKAKIDTRKRLPEIKNSQLKLKYGIDLEFYNQLLDTQDGVCAICHQRNNINRYLAVDHDHKTNVIRGLLCQQCNTGLGNFRDNIKSLKSAIEYLDLSEIANNVLKEIENAS